MANNIYICPMNPRHSQFRGVARMYVLHDSGGRYIEPEEGQPAVLLESIECVTCESPVSKFNISFARGKYLRISPLVPPDTKQISDHQARLILGNDRGDVHYMTSYSDGVREALICLLNKPSFTVWVWWDKQQLEYSLGSQEDPTFYMPRQS